MQAGKEWAHASKRMGSHRKSSYKQGKRGPSKVGVGPTIERETDPCLG